MLKGCTTGREYKLLRVEGVEADKELWMPASNRLDCTLYFEPVSGEDVSVDFTENLDAGQNPWEIKGISLQPALGFLQGSWEPVGDAGNVVAAFMHNRLLYDGEVWKYTAVPKGKNITLDITCGGVMRQLIAVQKGNGNILLKKDKKDKGTLLTRKAQPTGDDGYTYNPSTATPLFFRHGKVVLKGCVINNNTGSEQQKLMKILYQILDYCKKYFADEYGEWYGYLRRDGKPTQPACKGSTFKGPFHVPRCLILVDQMMTEILEK